MSGGSRLLDEAALERSCVVANSRMNRERVAVGANSYEKELGLNPLAFLEHCLRANGAAAWLDLCCGRGRALLEAAEQLRAEPAGSVVFHGVDLVDLFDDIPPSTIAVRFEACPLHGWAPSRAYDLITCVHGLHYIGDKLRLIERAASWLTAEGRFLAHLDLANLRAGDGAPLGRRVVQRFRTRGLDYSARRHLVSCTGPKSVSLGFTFLGADDTAGPNFSGQEAVSSVYGL